MFSTFAHLTQLASTLSLDHLQVIDRNIPNENKDNTEVNSHQVLHTNPDILISQSVDVDHLDKKNPANNAEEMLTVKENICDFTIKRRDDEKSKMVIDQLEREIDRLNNINIMNEIEIGSLKKKLVDYDRLNNIIIMNEIEIESLKKQVIDNKEILKIEKYTRENLQVELVNVKSTTGLAINKLSVELEVKYEEIRTLTNEIMEIKLIDQEKNAFETNATFLNSQYTIESSEKLDMIVESSEKYQLLEKELHKYKESLKILEDTQNRKYSELAICNDQLRSEVAVLLQNKLMTANRFDTANALKQSERDENDHKQQLRSALLDNQTLSDQLAEKEVRHSEMLAKVKTLTEKIRELMRCLNDSKSAAAAAEKKSLETLMATQDELQMKERELRGLRQELGGLVAARNTSAETVDNLANRVRMREGAPAAEVSSAAELEAAALKTAAQYKEQLSEQREQFEEMERSLRRELQGCQEAAAAQLAEYRARAQQALRAANSGSQSSGDALRQLQDDLEAARAASAQEAVVRRELEAEIETLRQRLAEANSRSVEPQKPPVLQETAAAPSPGPLASIIPDRVTERSSRSPPQPMPQSFFINELVRQLETARAEAAEAQRDGHSARSRLETLLLEKQSLAVRLELLEAAPARSRELSSGVNLEYLKQCVFHFMSSTEQSERRRLFPVISALLQLTPTERRAVEDALQQPTAPLALETLFAWR